MLQGGAPGADPDPLIPHPSERDLEPLWKEYSESRERYYYFREKLAKEMRARQAAQAPGYGTGTGADGRWMIGSPLFARLL